MIDPEQVEKRLATPILEFNYEHSFGELELPLVWITVPFWDSSTDKVIGRTYLTYYTPDNDTDGNLALDYGSGYYREGFNYPSDAEREKRIDCFKVAEVLYLHSMQLGNTQAMTNLGYLYLYNRLEKIWNYWDCFLADIQDTCAGENCQECMPAPPREQRAFECFERASKLGNTEAVYKLGDLYSAGTGCEKDCNRAFSLYQSAYQASAHDDACIWGSIAYRLASCYEDAKGTELNFAKALEYYRIAETGLDEAVRKGDNYYEKNLSKVRKAIKRLEQELAGH